MFTTRSLRADAACRARFVPGAKLGRAGFGVAVQRASPAGERVRASHRDPTESLASRVLHDPAARSNLSELEDATQISCLCGLLDEALRSPVGAPRVLDIPVLLRVHRPSGAALRGVCGFSRVRSLLVPNRQNKGRQKEKKAHIWRRHGRSSQTSRPRRGRRLCRRPTSCCSCSSLATAAARPAQSTAPRSSRGKSCQPRTAWRSRSAASGPCRSLVF